MKKPESPHRSPRPSLSPRSLPRRLVEPDGTLPEPARRRARMLSSMLLTLALLTLASLVVTLFVNPAGAPRRTEYLTLMAGLFMTLLLAYLLNRRRHYLTAAWLTVLCALVSPWLALVLDPTVLRGDFAPLTYTVVAILLSGILLSVYATVIVSLFQILTLWVVAGLTHTSTFINWPSLLIMVLFVSVLSLVANLVNRQDLAQIEDQARLLGENENLLREQSVRDHLTNLFNRRYLEETLARELRRAERNGSQLGVIMLDIDHFKQLNDSLGHAAGDALMRELGALLRSRIREADIACRYGGDEFTLVLPDTTRAILLDRAASLQEDVRKLHVKYEETVFDPISLSIGIAIYPEHGKKFEALLDAADKAMYRSKHEGLGRAVLADEIT